MAKRLVQGPAEPVWLVGADGEPIDAAHPVPMSGTVTTSGTVTANQGTAGAAWPVTDTWVPTLLAEEVADDSDKSFAVPASTQYQVLWIWVELTSTATVGNRQMTIEIQDSAADVIGRWKAGAVQAASLTRNYCFAPSNADLTAFRDTTFLMTPIAPTLLLPAGYIIRVYDSAAIAAAADDMVVQCMVALRSV